METAPRKISGSETRKRSRLLSVRMTEDEFAAVNAKAESIELTPASYARMALLDTPSPRAVRRPAVERANVARVLAQLGKIGSNLNQIAHHMNAGNTLANETLARALTDVSAMRDACLEAMGRKP